MRRAIYKAAALCLFFAPFCAWASAPVLPEAFYGSTNRSGEVDALINGAVVASTTAQGGRYGYPPHLFFVLDPAGDRAGKSVSFTIGGAAALASSTFQNGAITEADLFVAGISSSGPGSNSSGEAPPPPAKFLKLKIPKSFDLNGDRYFDLADITYLLARWGIAPLSPEDLNSDGAVDLYDFNLLIFKIHP